MGYYVQTVSVRNKALIIAKAYNGKVVSKEAAAMQVEAMGVIVVVDNGPFEAAGFAYNKEEFKRFTLPGDTRPKKFVVIERDEAERLTNYGEYAKEPRILVPG